MRTTREAWHLHSISLLSSMDWLNCTWHQSDNNHNDTHSNFTSRPDTPVIMYQPLVDVVMTTSNSVDQGSLAAKKQYPLAGPWSSHFGALSPIGIFVVVQSLIITIFSPQHIVSTAKHQTEYPFSLVFTTKWKTMVHSVTLMRSISTPTGLLSQAKIGMILQFYICRLHWILWTTHLYGERVCHMFNGRRML